MAGYLITYIHLKIIIVIVWMKYRIENLDSGLEFMEIRGLFHWDNWIGSTLLHGTVGAGSGVCPRIGGLL